jgi:hypothetical protein
MPWQRSDRLSVERNFMRGIADSTDPFAGASSHPGIKAAERETVAKGRT